MAWAQLIGSAISAYGNYKSNKRNEQGAKDALAGGIAAVEPKNVTGGFGSFTVDPDGTRRMELDERYAKERDYFLDDAALNKGFLTQYQQGGPDAAANTLFQQRVDPMRRNQARAEALFDEQANARGMLGATETFAARGANTQGYQLAENEVYNKSYMDVQDIIDRYRSRVTTGVNQAVNIEGLPSGYFDQSLSDAGNRASIVEAGMENVNTAQEASNAYNAKTATSLGNWIGKKKFPIGIATPATGMMSQPTANRIGSKMNRDNSSKIFRN